MKLLIVEDTKEYWEVARSTLACATVSLDFVETYQEALRKLEKENYDGVITDLMFPYDKTGNRETFRKLVSDIVKTIRVPELEDAPDSRYLSRDTDELVKSASEGVEQCMGVLVARECREKRVPYVVVTSGHGAHGDVTTPVATYMMISALITHYRGQTVEFHLRKIERDYGGEFPSLEEFAKKEAAEMYQLYRLDNKFITDADKSDPKTWLLAQKIIDAQIRGIF